MTTAQDAFSTLVATAVVPLLKTGGFRKKGLNFYRELKDIVHVIQLQKSTSSSSTEVRFTINVSVFSARLNELMRTYATWAPTITELPKEPECQMRRRIGALGPDKKDLWWTVPAAGPTPEVARDVRERLSQHALPFLEPLQSDENLRDHWLRAWKAGGFPEGVNLALLLLALGPKEELPNLLTSLRSTASPNATGLLATLDKIDAAIGKVGSE